MQAIYGVLGTASLMSVLYFKSIYYYALVLNVHVI